jgi:hypothetical protein
LTFKTDRARFVTIIPDIAKAHAEDVDAATAACVRAHTTKFEGQVCAVWADADERAANCRDLFKKLKDSVKAHGVDLKTVIFPPLYKAVDGAIST